MQKSPPSSSLSGTCFADQGWRAVLLIGSVAACLFAIRLAGPPNLLDQDQENPAGYVLDVLKNGNWIFQRDLLGNISSKPPLYTWLATLVSLASGKLTVFALYLPGALALFGTACLVFLFGRTYFGTRAALFGALAGMLCAAGAKQFGLARTDGVFAFTVTVGALLAYRAWMVGSGWTWFWLAAAAATLTKGPLGLVLSAMGLLAVLWERRTANPLPLRGSQWPGMLLFLILTAGWFGLACRQLGHAVFDKLVLRELVWHVVEGRHKNTPGTVFYLSPLYYLARAAPWSLLGYLALWRTWRFPAIEVQERRVERFLFCWFVGGLALFSVSAHQRGDLLWPIMPAAALLAGRELARLAARLEARQVNRLVGLTVIAGLAGFTIYYLGLRARRPLVRQTIALRELASQLEKVGGREFPLTHADDPKTLQVYLNTYRAPVTFELAATLLRSSEACFVAVSDLASLQTARKSDDPPIYTVLEDNGPEEKLQAKIIGNRPALGLTNRMALAVGPWLVRYQGHLLEATEDHFTFAVAERPGQVSVINEGKESRQLRLRFADKHSKRDVVQLVAPGQRLNASIER